MCVYMWVCVVLSVCPQRHVRICMFISICKVQLLLERVKEKERIKKKQKKRIHTQNILQIPTKHFLFLRAHISSLGHIYDNSVFFILPFIYLSIFTRVCASLVEDRGNETMGNYILSDVIVAYLKQIISILQVCQRRGNEF